MNWTTEKSSQDGSEATDDAQWVKHCMQMVCSLKEDMMGWCIGHESNSLSQQDG